MIRLSRLGRNAARAACAMLFLLLHGWAGVAQAQSRATADRTFGLAAYAGGSYGQTDYGSKDTGYLVGGNLNTTFHHFEPALDVRYTSLSGSVVNQTSFAGGLKVQRKFGPLRPYVDLEAGMGTIHFNFSNGTSYTHDNSVIEAFGGGVDIRIVRWIDFKADAQYQFWKLGDHSSYLTPFITSVGIAYRIPYHSLTSH